MAKRWNGSKLMKPQKTGPVTATFTSYGRTDSNRPPRPPTVEELRRRARRAENIRKYGGRSYS